ncbi:hypothetical protein Acr_21g0008600 [Actinidia rufa]|uniref:Uncharacterized protein n=1 Tax=Actinidia rufa TaxID=165716 RepID=A0A7J0GHQ5_9ERIC|nr:hypothetical protein Acr_21g0008600 [Actinidia rufa]
MEVDVTGPRPIGGRIDEDRLRVKRKTLEAVLEQCQRALESLSTADTGDFSDGDASAEDGDDEAAEGSSSGPCGDKETEELCDLLKSRVECPDFLEKLESAQASVSQNKAEEGSSSWDMINDNDLWEGGDTEPDQEDYVVVRQEDIVEGIACFMAAYLLSLKQTKDLPKPGSSQGRLSSLLDFLSCHIKAFISGLFGEDVLMVGTRFLNVVFVHAEASI